MLATLSVALLPSHGLTKTVPHAKLYILLSVTLRVGCNDRVLCAELPSSWAFVPCVTEFHQFLVNPIESQNTQHLAEISVPDGIGVCGLFCYNMGIPVGGGIFWFGFCMCVCVCFDLVGLFVCLFQFCFEF